ncbi:RNA-binding domain-containing protein [Lentisalinibacter salinarum]|uniref:RNA-binding domain-containing protein n=1 Tax=Lentisalinibacter salinarum TaxID=2992239 RepID=UPI00386324B0
MAWNAPPSGFATLLLELGNAPQERTLDELCNDLDIPDEEHLLTKLKNATVALDRCGIDARPPLQNGGPGEVHLLIRRDQTPPQNKSILDELARGEHSSQEFKTTYWCDYQRMQHQQDATSTQLRSPQVKQSALKAVAGFLTTGGGVLYIGVSDGGEVVGLAPDLSLYQPDQRTVDSLINSIKTDISERFHEGRSVNDYVQIRPIALPEGTILRVEVSARRKLSFLADGESSARPYRRQENRTVAVEFVDFEEFVEWRRENGLV